MRINEPQPRLVVAVYESADDLAPEAQAPLVTRLEQSTAQGPTCVVVIFLPAVRSIGIELPTFWLGVTGRLKLAGSAIVTQSMAVRAVGKGFALATRARREAPVEVFQTEPEAVAWASAILASSQA